MWSPCSLLLAGAHKDCLFPVPRLSQNFKLPHFHPVLTFAISVNEIMLFHCSSLFSVLWNIFLKNNTDIFYAITNKWAKMKMDTWYMCSWHLWSIKFCCILGHCSCIQQLITSRSWSSSLFTTLFSAPEMHQGHHSDGLLCCEKGSIFIMQLQQLGCLKAALSTLLQSHIGEFGFQRLLKNNKITQPKKPLQSKKKITLQTKQNHPGWQNLVVLM